MYQFLLDALATLRMRYLPQEEYRYPITVVIAILAILTLINATALSLNTEAMLATTTDSLPAGSDALQPIFASKAHLIIMAFFAVLLRLGTLTFGLQKILGYYGAKKLHLIGFIFLTEALSIPILALVYIPDLKYISPIWQFWTLLVQVIGIVHLSGLSPFKVIIGYIGSFFLFIIAFIIFCAFAFTTGIIDAEALVKNIEIFQKLQQLKQ